MGGPISYEVDKIDRYLKAADRVGIAFAGLIEALGGLLAVDAFPILDFYEEMQKNQGIAPHQMSAPLMRGHDRSGRPFIALKYRDGTSAQVAILFQEYRESPNFWSFAGKYLPLFGQEYGINRSWGNSSWNGKYAVSDIAFANALRFKEALDRISRLVQQQPVGRIGFDGKSEGSRVSSDGQSVLSLI